MHELGLITRAALRFVPRLILPAALVLLSAGGASLEAAVPASSPRIVTPLMTGWRFHDGAEPADAASPRFSDAGWQQVALPHSWNALGEYALKNSEKTRN